MFFSFSLLTATPRGNKTHFIQIKVHFNVGTDTKTNPFNMYPFLHQIHSNLSFKCFVCNFYVHCDNLIHQDATCVNLNPRAENKAK